LNNIKKEIQVLESLINKEKLNNYLNNLIDFAGDALDEFDELNKLFDQVKKEFCEVSESLGEKKTAKPKEIFQPIYNFLKSFQ